MRFAHATNKRQVTSALPPEFGLRSASANIQPSPTPQQKESTSGGVLPAAIARQTRPRLRLAADGGLFHFPSDPFFERVRLACSDFFFRPSAATSSELGP